MNLSCESNNIENYLLELPEVNFSHPTIQAKATELFNPFQTEIEKAKIAFEFVQ